MALVLNGSGYGAYLHCTPDHVPFYVGKGKRKRMNDFHGRNHSHAAIVEQFGKRNIKKVFIECSTEQNALDLEVGLIKCLKRMNIPLANRNSGGTRGNVGFVHSEETRKKLSEMFKGIHRSPETEFKEGNNPLFTGKNLSEESKQTISLKIKKVMENPERREINRQNLIGNKNMLGKKHSQETLQKMRDAKLGKKMPDEVKSKIAKARTGNTVAKGRIWVNNGAIEKMVYADNIPDNFVKGRISWR